MGDRHDALETLTTAVRRLVEATVRTGHDADRLEALATRVDALADELGSTLDDDPWKARSRGDFVSDPAGIMGINPAVGRSNPTAPVVDLRLGEGGLAGTVRFDMQHVGPPYRAHGGVVASLLDQALGLAVIAGGSPGMTTSMTVRYRRATPLQEDLRFEARITSAEGGTSTATGEIYDNEGRVTAEAEATFRMAKETM